MTATLRTVFLLYLALSAWPHTASAAGTLTPAGAADSPLRILDHHLQVLIENGYARSEITQTFENDNIRSVEGIYSVPLPAAAALSELSISGGDRSLFGEVIKRDQAQLIYESERNNGNQVGLAVKQGYQRFEFRIGNVAAGDRVTAQLGVQYQLVTDETSMIVLDEDTLARFGIDPNNRERTAREADARMLRTAGTPVNQSVPVDASFTGALPSGGSAASSGSSGGSSGFGGGATTPWDLLLVGGLSLGLLLRRKRSARCA